MKAIKLPHFKNEPRDVSRELLLDHGLELPDDLKTYGRGDPFNFCRSEWQQAQRIGVDPKEIKQPFREVWETMADVKALVSAMVDNGLYLAKGNSRGHVAVDINGNINALTRWMSIKTKDVRARLRDPADSKSVAEGTARLRNRNTDKLKDDIQQIKVPHGDEIVSTARKTRCNDFKSARRARNDEGQTRSALDG